MPRSASRNAFAKANAQKLLAMPLYALGVAASLVVKRRPGLWVFGCGSGIGEGALPLYRRAAEAGEHELLWLARDEREAARARELGIQAVPKMSWRGFTATLRAGVIVVTHGLGDVNRFGTRGAFVVQLWHGIPLKRINLDSAITTSSGNGLVSRMLGRLYRLAASTISVMPAASELSASRLSSAFALDPARIVVTGDPRDDVVVLTAPDEARATLLRALDRDDDGRRIVLYAPTWRDGAADPAVPTDTEWRLIEQWLEATNSLLVVRPHPLGVGDYRAARPNVALLTSAAQNDVNPILAGVDILITDYSSVAFDFALTGRPIAFFAPDRQSYEASRGLYEPYPSFSGGSERATWAEVLDLLDEPGALDRLARHSASLNIRHHAFRDGQNTARVYAEITRRLKVPEMTSTLPVGSTLPEVAVDSVEFVSPTTLRVSGPLDATPLSVSLVGPRAVITGSIELSASRWQATIELLVSRWHGPLLPPPSGTYRLECTTASAHGTPVITGALPADTLVDDLFRIEFSGLDVATAPLTVHLSAPLKDSERGAAAQAALEATYRSSSPTPANAVFFESFYGQNASCNPRAIDAALAELCPSTTRYWSTVDASVEIPDGAVRIIEGSEQWWNVRASARVLVVNDWLRKRYRKRSHQKVVQTWHGTPLKKIALGRPRLGLRPALATLRERARWDILLAQNPHTASIMRRAYAFLGPIWQEGYPRDDVLATPDASLAATVRSRLDIADDVTVVLYAPTWRDDKPGHVDHLDVAAFTDALGPGYVTLIRGHSRSLRPGRNVHAANVIDVTGYPDVSDLFLVADVLVTDYSSVMFDFSVTGKPVFFFAPDLEHYREQLRGFYFDLDAVAIGPVVQDPDELVRLVAARDQIAEQYRERYVEWRDRFNPRDDGGAADRVVRRMLGEGFFD